MQNLFILTDMHIEGSRGSGELIKCGLISIKNQRELLTEIIKKIESSMFVMEHRYQILLVAMFMGYTEVTPLIFELDHQTREALTTMICQNYGWYDDFSHIQQGFRSMFTAFQVDKMKAVSDAKKSRQTQSVT